MIIVCMFGIYTLSPQFRHIHSMLLLLKVRFPSLIGFLFTHKFTTRACDLEPLRNDCNGIAEPEILKTLFHLSFLAIAWSPHHHGLLASGGGTADRRIRFWNTLTGQPMQCIDTGSQVCNLIWSKHTQEFVSIYLFIYLTS